MVRINFNIVYMLGIDTAHTISNKWSALVKMVGEATWIVDEDEAP